MNVVSILSIGKELLRGKTINTNASWLASQISSVGGIVKRIIVVDDKLDEIVEEINSILKKDIKIIVTTGGLGPTFDDITFESIAKAFKKKLL